MSKQNVGKLIGNSDGNKPQDQNAHLVVRTLPELPEAPEEPDMISIYVKVYENKVDDLIKLLAKTAGSKDGAKIIKHLPGFEGKNAVKELQKHPDTFIKSFQKNDDNLESLLDAIQDSKLGDKLIALLERTPAGQRLFKEIADKIESELNEYNEAMLQYEQELTAYEIALDEFINPAFLPAEDESVTDEIIAEAEAKAEAELSVEDAAAAAAQAEEELLVSEEEVLVDEEIITEGEVISDEEIVVDEEVLVDGEVVIEEEVTSNEEVEDESITPPVSG
ncbi:MAG: hypothetical protein EXQ80_04590 [Candidatus Nanopelagicaceae bacterium]|nr:hypothetical protein [Candidatus Nanopelagicaceae bacterium]